MKGLNVLVLLLVMQTANSACIWVIHQPEFLEAANKFKLIIYIIYEKEVNCNGRNIITSNYRSNMWCYCSFDL